VLRSTNKRRKARPLDQFINRSFIHSFIRPPWSYKCIQRLDAKRWLAYISRHLINLDEEIQKIAFVISILIRLFSFQYCGSGSITSQEKNQSSLFREPFELYTHHGTCTVFVLWRSYVRKEPSAGMARSAQDLRNSGRGTLSFDSETDSCVDFGIALFSHIMFLSFPLYIWPSGRFAPGFDSKNGT
jgi:hypothetical protein